MKEEMKGPPAVYMIGDSTMADKSLEGGNPERGWGQLLSECFREGVRICNHARDGRSTKSFVDEGLWEPVRTSLRAGDWLVIQFGHNDQKKDQPHLYSESASTYREILTRFVREAQARGAQPILATSIYRRQFTEEGELRMTLGDYPDTMRALAGELGVPLVDLNQQTGALFRSLGPDKTQTLFLHFSPGELPFYPEGKKDDTHLSLTGARQVAGLFAESLPRQKIGLAHWLKAAPAI